MRRQVPIFILLLAMGLLMVWFMVPKPSEEQRLLHLLDACAAPMERAMALTDEDPRIISVRLQGSGIEAEVDERSVEVDPARLLEIRKLLRQCGLSRIDVHEVGGVKVGVQFFSARDFRWSIVSNYSSWNTDGEQYVDDISAEIEKGDPERHLFLNRKIDRDWSIKYVN